MAACRGAWTAVLAVLAGCATAPVATDEHARLPSFERWTVKELVRFEGEQEVSRYVRDLRRAGAARGAWWARPRSNSDEGDIIVTGSRIVPRNPSITNVQEEGVDEGDIVKQIDRFLIVLQDGRLFSLDTNADGRGALALADRVDVYRSRETAADWYDEILVRGDRIVVTGYSYRHDVSELSLFRLGPDGRFVAEAKFQISSEDYYDPENYATRLVGDNLILYTPLDLTQLSPRQPVRVPTVRRLGRYGEAAEPRRPDRADIYRPLQLSYEPTLHSIAVCPIGAAARGRLDCRTTSFIGPSPRKFYATPDDIFLWLVNDEEESRHLVDEARCNASPGGPENSVGSVLYRLPVSGGDPSVLGLRGWGFDQFSLDVFRGRFRALVHFYPETCDPDADLEEEPPLDLGYAELALAQFGGVLRDAPNSAFSRLPSLPEGELANRFTDTHLVYGPLLARKWSEDGDPEPVPSPLILVPLARPDAPLRLELPHNIFRAERAGEDIVLTGYRPGG
ncbi:beta-propeller domain-containing protein, partial [Allosphingosinicella sp.]|uniref:beta-propeller domain-containing protein n=1 Tax=Allosphingosinicella sp. TaxID=2823234 RepID=UPI002F146D16